MSESAVASETPVDSIATWRSAARPAVFAIVAAVVVIATTRWANKLLVESHHDIFNLYIFQYLFVRYDAPAAMQVGAALVVAVIAAVIVPASWYGRLALWITNNHVLVASLSFAALATGAYVAYDNYPLSLDEFAQYFQAQIFAAGHLHGHYDLSILRGLVSLPGQFITYSAKTGDTMSGYWPGLPLLITPFMFLGIPWVTNPLVGTAGILLIRRLALRLMPETPEAAGWAMLLMLASPAFTANAISYYAMNVYLVSGLAYAILLLDPTPRRLFAAGVLGSLALAQHNPVPHALFALPWIAWLVVRPDRVRRIFWLGLGYLPLTLLLVVGWLSLTSHAVSDAPETVRNGASVSRLDAMMRFVHNDVWGMVNSTILKNRAMASLKVYLWAVPGLPVIAIWGYRRLRLQTAARLLAWSAIVTFVTYLFVTPDQGHGWGYRYFHAAWGVLPLFGAAWVTQPEGVRWVRLVGPLALISLLVLNPLRMLQIHEFIKQSEGMAPAHDPDKDQVTFVNVQPGEGRYYAWDAVRNDPFLRNSSIVFRSMSPERDETFVKSAYPGARLQSQTVHGTVWDISGDFPPAH